MRLLAVAALLGLGSVGCSSRVTPLEDPVTDAAPLEASSGDGGTGTPDLCAAQHVHCDAVSDDAGKLVWCGSCPTGQTCGGLGANGGPALPGFCGCDGLTADQACMKQAAGTAGMQTNGCSGDFVRSFDCDSCGWPNFETAPGSGICTTCVGKGVTTFCSTDTNVDGGAPREADCPSGVLPVNASACDKYAAGGGKDYWCCP